MVLLLLLLTIGVAFLLFAGVVVQPWNLALMVVLAWAAWPRRQGAE